MPKIEVNGVNIAYEIAGEGPAVVWTEGGWMPRMPSAGFFAGRLSSAYKVLTWDRRNTGSSDIAIIDSPSEWHLWSDDLHALLRSLDMAPAYVGGGSAGCILSLLFAHRYPDDVKGLILQEPGSDDHKNIFNPVGKAHYAALAEAAEKGGMQEVINVSSDPGDVEMAWASGWVAQSIDNSPENRERILALDPIFFAAVMRKWGKWFSSPRAFLANITDDDLKKIIVPAIVAHGLESFHPERTARVLCDLLPNAVWANLSEYHSEKEIKIMTEMANTEGYAWSMWGAFYAPFWEDFLRRVEAGEFVGKK